jgi:hypothetical protein
MASDTEILQEQLLAARNERDESVRNFEHWSHRFIHLQILMAACESRLTLLQRRAAPNPEILDLLIVASGYPANQGVVVKCSRTTFALSEYEYIISASGANALDSLSW